MDRIIDRNLVIIKALNDGWTVKKTDHKTFEFTKNDKSFVIKKEIIKRSVTC
jgi:hypothetical protein